MLNIQIWKGSPECMCIYTVHLHYLHELLINREYAENPLYAEDGESIYIEQGESIYTEDGTSDADEVNLVS